MSNKIEKLMTMLKAPQLFITPSAKIWTPNLTHKNITIYDNEKRRKLYQIRQLAVHGDREQEKEKKSVLKLLIE